MNIKIASEKTGLTKKAIKYYESEGLITPSKKFENNYREYSEEDITKLNLIGALRALDISVKEIKDVIMGEKSLPQALKDTISKIDENINHLEKSRLIISSIIEKNLNDYKASGEQIRKLRETLELSRDDKKEFIANNLLRIFPGGFGKMLVIMYEPFLRVSIDNDEKEKVWLKLVEFLDSVDEIDEIDYPVKEFSEIDNVELIKYKKEMDNQVKELLNYDDNIKDIKINSQIEFTKSLKENEDTKQKFIKSLEITRKLIKLIGPIQKDFQEYLCLLNEDYKKYTENTMKMMLDIDNGVKDSLGFDLKEFVDSFEKKI